MGNRRKQKQKEWRDKHGILGELQLTPDEVLILDEIMRKMRFGVARASVATYYSNLSGQTYAPILSEDCELLSDKLNKLATSLRAKERTRLSLSYADDTEKDDSMLYCC